MNSCMFRDAIKYCFFLSNFHESCWFCVDASEIRAVVLDQTLKPDLVINAGTAGGFKKHDTSIGDVFISSRVRNHDRRSDGRHLDKASPTLLDAPRATTWRGECKYALLIVKYLSTVVRLHVSTTLRRLRVSLRHPMWATHLPCSNLFYSFHPPWRCFLFSTTIRVRFVPPRPLAPEESPSRGSKSLALATTSRIRPRPCSRSSVSRKAWSRREVRSTARTRTTRSWKRMVRTCYGGTEGRV